MPMCEEALATALGGHFRYDDWSSAFTAVYTAEEAGEDPHDALDREREKGLTGCLGDFRYVDRLMC